MTAPALSRSFLLLAQCVPSIKHNASRFKVRKMELDPNLLMYFSKFEFVYAHDPEKKCKTGDVVLIEELPQKMTRLITHKVKTVVYPLGDVVDPLTNKKVVAGKYRDEIDIVNKAFGVAPSAFDYDSAPERGWQEDRKDFTHVETYVKYHEYDDDDQPHSV